MPHHQFEPLFEDLEGTILVVPAISELCPDWPLGINPYLDDIQDDFFAWVHHWFKEERIRNKIAKLDAPGFAAMNYPEAAREQLLTMAKLIAWYFPWDDAIDDGSLYYKPELLKQYYDDTIAVTEQSLSWEPKPQEKPHPNPAIQCFWELGVDIRSRGTPATNEQFRWAQCEFVKSSVEGQQDRELTEPIPVEQYLCRRERNIAVFPLLSLIYYNYQFDIPEKYWFKNNKHMNKMWRLLARMGIISNDMLSLRREIMHGQFESLIPLLMYHDNLQPQQAMRRAGDMLHQCYNTFNDVEKELYLEVPADLQPTMVRYVKACKDLIVCNLHWSYGLRRYMEPGMLQPDGRVVFPIRLPKKKVAAAIGAEKKVAVAKEHVRKQSQVDMTMITRSRDWTSEKTWSNISSWFSVVPIALVPIGLGIAAVFGKQVFSILRSRHP